MQNNTIPPLQDDAAFLQLPFDQPIIPYADLKVTGQPERKLLLQDDLPMTMSVLTAKGSVQQRLVTQNDDGGVNVHVVNQSGGGSSVGITPVAWYNIALEQQIHIFPGTNDNIYSFNPGINLKTLYGFTASLSLDAAPAAGNNGSFSLYLGRQSNSKIIVLWELQFNSPGHGTDIPPNTYSTTQYFPIPLDPVPIIGINNINQCLSANCSVDAHLSYALFAVKF